MVLIDKAINAKRDIQTIEPVCCKKCRIKPYIPETGFRDRYKVVCIRCGTETEWFGKIDNAVINWNNMINIE